MRIRICTAHETGDPKLFKKIESSNQPTALDYLRIGRTISNSRLRNDIIIR